MSNSIFLVMENTRQGHGYHWWDWDNILCLFSGNERVLATWRGGIWHKNTHMQHIVKTLFDFNFCVKCCKRNPKSADMKILPIQNELLKSNWHLREFTFYYWKFHTCYYLPKYINEQLTISLPEYDCWLCRYS